MLTVDLEPLLFRHEPLAATLGVGCERRLLGHRAAVMIAIDASGGKIGHPFELRRACREIRRVLRQHRIALRRRWCGCHHVRHAIECR